MISVIVTTYNRRELLSRCLQLLAEQDCPRSEYEVVVVVDGSTDGTQELLRSLQTDVAVRVIDQPNRGLAAARNAGLSAAAHKVVLFLDDDLMCAPQVISEHIRAHDNEERVLAFGPVLVSSEKSEHAAARATQNFYAEDIYRPLERGESATWPVHARVPPNSSISKQLLLSFGGFDEKFVNAHEDVELGIRLWRDGVSFRYLPKAEVEHVYGKSTKDLAVAEARRAGKCEVMLCRKHEEYRPISQLSAAKNTRLYRNGLGDVLLRSRLASSIASGAIAGARGMRLKEDWLLGAESNLNMLSAAVDEAGSWQKFRSEFWVRLPVLLYHHIGEAKRGAFPELTIEPGPFAHQMQWLDENGYVPIATSDWLRWCESAVPLPEKPVLITFDDAYDDLVRHAFPVLQEHNFKATVFVPTAYVGQGNIWDQRNGRPPIGLMNAGAIREWAGKGIEFGAHSRTHPELDNIDGSACAEEIMGSRDDLEKMIDAPVVAFAYPYGNYNREVQDAVGRSFRLAFTTEDGMNTLGTDLLRLHRTMVEPEQSMVDFVSRVRFGCSIPEHERKRLRKLIFRQ